MSWKRKNLRVAEANKRKIPERTTDPSSVQRWTQETRMEEAP